MASELSRLIDDELQKVEREAREDESKHNLRTSLRIKTSPQKNGSAELPPTWRQTSWWTWKRTASAAAFFVLFVGTAYLVLGSSSTAQPADSMMSSTEDAEGFGNPEAMYTAAAPDDSPVLEKVPTEPVPTKDLSSEGTSGKGSGQKDTLPPATPRHTRKQYPPKHQESHAPVLESPPKAAEAPSGSAAVPQKLASAATGMQSKEQAPDAVSSTPSGLLQGVAPEPAAQSLPHAPTWSKQLGRRLLM